MYTFLLEPKEESRNGCSIHRHEASVRTTLRPTQRAPHVELVFDRFHVAQLASRAVDEVRRALWRQHQGTDAGKTIKESRYALLKSPWNLSRCDKERLAAVKRNNEPLYRAYLLKEALAQALDYRQPGRARRALEDWLAWACRSRLEPFIKLAKTIRKHQEGILAYVGHRMTNAVVEGFNNKMRSVARRAYGFHSASALIGMMFLCIGGIELQPPLPSPTQP
jgi:transposase